MSTVIFAGGGSGGHIYPGLAIAEELARVAAEGTAPPPQALFVCSDRALDASILSAAGRTFERSPAKPIILRPRGIVRFLASWGPSVRQARRLIREARARGPVHVAAMGGFVAAPFVQAARAERCPVTMVNLDAVPGKANRWIAPRAARVFSAASVPPERRPRCAEWIEVPPIVRASARATLDRTAACAALGLDAARPVLMITGGSQGLRSLNEFVTALAGSEQGRVALVTGRWQVLHQTGRGGDEAAKNAYAAAGVDARVVPFTDQMGLWWSAADAAICTAGAGNVAEVWASATPALMLPYPHHRDQHQKFNAAPLQRVGGVIVGVDRIEPTANVAENGAGAVRILTDLDARAAMRAALRGLGPVNGAERVARALLDAVHADRAGGAGV